MPKINAFEEHPDAYEAWFEEHPHVYASEIDAIRQLMPTEGKGLEVGIGTGRFADPFGICIGVEPSPAMRGIARAKGFEVVAGVAEALPFADEQFDFVLFVTTICFVDSLAQAFHEAYRILKPGGVIVNGFVDRDSSLGQKYQRRRAKSRFYRDATFRSVDEVAETLQTAGFHDQTFVQTIFRNVDEIHEREPVSEGYGKGAFVGVRAIK